MIRTKWYEEGLLAYQLGKSRVDCPYKEYSYGYAQWMKGYESIIHSH